MKKFMSSLADFQYWFTDAANSIRGKKKKLRLATYTLQVWHIICVNICFPFIGSHIPASYLRRRPFIVCIWIELCVATKGIRFTLPFASIQPLYSEPSHFSAFPVLCSEMNMEQKKACIWWRHFDFSATKICSISFEFLKKKIKKKPKFWKNEL